MKYRKHSYASTGAILALTLILALPGCANMGWGQKSSPPNPVTQQSSLPSGSGSPASSPSPSSSASPRPMFYDFQDIPIPNELTLLADESYVFQSGQFKAGLITLRGRVDLGSLINFFQMAMPRENWHPKGGFRYRRSVLIFDKPDKTCVINIYEKLYYSYVEIYVAPANEQI